MCAPSLYNQIYILEDCGPWLFGPLWLLYFRQLAFYTRESCEKGERVSEDVGQLRKKRGFVAELKRKYLGGKQGGTPIETDVQALPPNARQYVFFSNSMARGRRTAKV